MGKFSDRLSHAWNAFMNKDPTYPTTPYSFQYSGGNNSNPDRVILTRGNERSIINSIYNRIAMDVAANTFKHAQLDNDGRFKKVIDDGLNQCLTVEANLDQTGRAFIQNLVISMLDEGNIAVVPVQTTLNPNVTASYDIISMRIGKIMEWFPKDVRVRCYDEKIGQKVDTRLKKEYTAIIENPFYIVMNEPNSMANRLMRKLSLMDVVDERNYSGKLDLILQLPYIVKSQTRKDQAERRRKEMEDQLANSTYGIAYTDGTEKIVQLNRSLENNFMKQIEYFQNLLFSQFGITQGILDGTADENTMTNYITRTIEPICAAIVDEMTRKFLSKKARSMKQAVIFYNNPLKLVPVSKMAELADKLTRNEIVSSNEIRTSMGFAPSNDPSADELRNKNINQATGEGLLGAGNGQLEDYDSSMQDLDDIDEQIKELEKLL